MIDFERVFNEVELSYVRSSGPGGQNVNKVNSKAVLRWRPSNTQGMIEVFRLRVQAKLQDRLTGEGDLIITSDRYRDQPRNREDCLKKLKDILTQAIAVPKPRRPAKPTRSSVRRNKESKKHQSEKKRLRRDF